MKKRKLALSWSSGKDSAWTLYQLRDHLEWQVETLVTTVNEQYDRVAMHAVRRELLREQARAAALPLLEVMIPVPCSNEIYEAQFAKAVRQLVDDGFEGMAFGDLFLQDIREYRESRLAGSGLQPLFPLWQRPTAKLADEMIAGGLQAVVTCVDPKQLDAAFAGRSFDQAFLDELPTGVDPCGENGEYHTFCHAGPMFAQPIAITAGEVVDRDGFVFADLVPTT